MLQPTENEFEQLAAKGFNLIPVFEEVAADLETPVSAFLKIARGDYAFLLESVRGGEKWGRYTFLGSDPFMVMRARKNRMDIIRPGRGIEVRSVAQLVRGVARRGQALPRARAAQPAALLRRRGRIPRV